MADEQVGDAEFLLQIQHQVEHLRLHRHIERAHGLVGHDEAGAGDECARNRNALALAARKLVRVFVQVGAAQAHLRQHLRGLLALLGAAGSTLGLQGLGDDALHGVVWVQRAIGVLEHHLKVAPRVAQLGGGQAVQVAAQQVHRAAGGRVERHHQPGQRGFARARFTHDAQAAARRHGEIHALQRLHLLRRLKKVRARQRVVAHQLRHLQQGWMRIGRCF